MMFLPSYVSIHELKVRVKLCKVISYLRTSEKSAVYNCCNFTWKAPFIQVKNVNWTYQLISFYISYEKAYMIMSFLLPYFLIPSVRARRWRHRTWEDVLQLCSNQKHWLTGKDPSFDYCTKEDRSWIKLQPHSKRY
jgi:hypothetical protein